MHKMLFYTFRYTGHKNTDYRIDSCLNSKDTHILSGSEDGQVYIWDLIEVKIPILQIKCDGVCVCMCVWFFLGFFSCFVLFFQPNIFIFFLFC